MAGGRDETFDAGRCAELVAQLRAGGSDTSRAVFDDAETGKTSRTLSLGFCTDGNGYKIRSNPAARARSTAELARFLNRVLGNTAQPAG